jgi:hypothetical protein
MAAVIVNYCSNEKEFIETFLKEAQKFTNEIIVSYGSHLYDGTPENFDEILKLENCFPLVKFVQYNVDLSLDLTKQKGVHQRPTAYWHNLARWTAVQKLSERTRWVFVLDVDEIPDGDAVAQWLSRALPLLKDNECYKLANYWYFKHPTNRAQTLEDSVLLIHRKYLTETNLFHDYERDGLIHLSQCMLKRQIKGINDKIMFHHYSWCRNRKSLEHKIKHWGHSNEYEHVDRLVEYIFKDDNVNDVIHRYTYDKVDNRFGIQI